MTTIKIKNTRGRGSFDGVWSIPQSSTAPPLPLALSPEEEDELRAEGAGNAEEEEEGEELALQIMKLLDKQAADEEQQRPGKYAGDEEEVAGAGAREGAGEGAGNAEEEEEEEDEEEDEAA